MHIKISRCVSLSSITPAMFVTDCKITKNTFKRNKSEEYFPARMTEFCKNELPSFSYKSLIAPLKI